MLKCSINLITNQYCIYSHTHTCDNTKFSFLWGIIFHPVMIHVIIHCSSAQIHAQLLEHNFMFSGKWISQLWCSGMWPCTLVSRHQHFGGICYLNLHGRIEENKPINPNYTREVLCWKWRCHVTPKCWYLMTHLVTCQITVILLIWTFQQPVTVNARINFVKRHTKISVKTMQLIRLYIDY